MTEAGFARLSTIRIVCTVIATVSLFSILHFVGLAYSDFTGFEIYIDDRLQGWSLFLLPGLVVTSIYLGIASFSGSLSWFCVKRFTLKTFLIGSILGSIFIISASPGIRWALAGRAAKNFILHEMDQEQIRDSARGLFDYVDGIDDHGILLRESLPKPIADTNPIQVTVYGIGWVKIEYESNPDVGVWIVADGTELPDGQQLIEGMSYYEN